MRNVAGVMEGAQCCWCDGGCTMLLVQWRVHNVAGVMEGAQCCWCDGGWGMLLV